MTIVKCSAFDFDRDGGVHGIPFDDEFEGKLKTFLEEKWSVDGLKVQEVTEIVLDKVTFAKDEKIRVFFKCNVQEGNV
jgi:hypothetical protein